MNSEVIAEKHHQLSFYVRRCVKYHSYRAAFFGKLNVTTAFVGVLFGSATLTSLVAQAPGCVTIATSLIVTIFSAFDLVIGTGKKTWEHNELKKRYMNVELELLGAAPDTTSEIKLKEIEIKIRQIELDEPPELQFLNAMAENEIIMANYSAREASQYVSKLPWLKRVTANFIDWDVSAYISSPV
jgi:hypothetical protein